MTAQLVYNTALKSSDDLILRTQLQFVQLFYYIDSLHCSDVVCLSEIDLVLDVCTLGFVEPSFQ